MHSCLEGNSDSSAQGTHRKTKPYSSQRSQAAFALDAQVGGLFAKPDLHATRLQALQLLQLISGPICPILICDLLLKKDPTQDV